jgi:hypothetical protein
VGAQAESPGEAVPASSGGAETGPHILFQIRPAGAGAPLIDPKPILDGWVALENTSIFRAKGKRAFAHVEPSPGQALLESKEQLQQQVLANRGIHIYACGRADIEAGAIDRRVLAALEFLAVSNLRPTVSALRCASVASRDRLDALARASGDAAGITAVNGIALAGEGSASLARRTVGALRLLQGQMKPHVTSRAGVIDVAFTPLGAPRARLASALSPTVSPSEWIRLISRLGEIPNPTVARKPSAAALPDNRTLEGGARGNH